ncbi:MAG: exodeoxyribonuclease V subunit gamma [Endozoicomonas sp.]
MFTIFHSNQLDVLKDLLVELIQRDPLPDPLADEQILVQSPGMAQWLRQELAEGLGIAASIDFPLPASFLWDMFVRVLPDVPKRSAFNKEAMTWKIIALLPEMVDQEAFAALRQYLADDHDGVRLYQLAEKIADTFDQYLVYRPEWIADWEMGQDPAGITTDQPWQPELWRALVRKTAELGQSHWHRANMHNRFLDELHNGQHQSKLPSRLFVFGISALPPHFVETLNALGQQTDVHLLVCNPCRYYWGDEKDPRYLARMIARKFSSHQLASSLPAVSSSTQDGFCQQGLSLDDPDAPGNPLLGSMGKLGRDYLHQLHALDTPDISAFVDGSEHSLLQAIQSDILELRDRNDHKTIPGSDRSLELHSCHSALREVEVLHDQLLAMFEQNPDLTPKDVVVMLPDVDQYSPWIQAVFGGHSGSEANKDDSRRIPFSISDRSARNEHPILTGLLRLLNLDNSRCTAPEILELLEIPALQRRFDLSAEDFATLRRWVNDTGIRWGISPEHQQYFDLPPRDSNSWRFGLRRMLLGYAMPEASGLYDDTLPFEPVQGMSARLAGQLADFIERTDRLIQSINKPRTITEWIQAINTLMDTFFMPDEADEYALILVHDSLEHLHQQVQDAAYGEPLSRPVLLAYLTERLTSQRSSQRFLAGQVNFCTLMPMRSIPFKVVCLLGLNDGAYPRSIPPAGFDLIAQHSRRGDRSRREDDRYLFLEALLSAREKLYISYVGHSIKDNTERVPSVLVTELLNYCEQSFAGEQSCIRRQLLTEHPLQPFSPSNFLPGGELFSYAHEWLSAAQHNPKAESPFLLHSLPTPEEQVDTIELSELLRFYRNCCKHFFNRRLKVYFEEGDEQLPDTEPFTIDGLEAYSLKQGILESLLTRGDDLSELQTNLKATGQLPHGAFGELLLEEQQKQLNKMVTRVREAIVTPADDVEVNLNIEGQQLTGWLKQMYDTGLVRFRPARTKGRDIMLTWIEHLCYCASVPSPEFTLLYGLDNQILFNPVSQAEALEQLGNLIEHYHKGHNEPLAFFPETAYTWLTADDEKATKAAIERFNGGFYPGENSDAYIGRCYPLLEPVFDDMTRLSTDLMQPLMPYMEVSK